VLRFDTEPGQAFDLPQAEYNVMLQGLVISLGFSIASNQPDPSTPDMVKATAQRRGTLPLPFHWPAVDKVPVYIVQATRVGPSVTGGPRAARA